ncbi:MAG: glycerophosphodiester phosphodiesterase family protein [Bacteroidia bacterium]|nr:glycerophosphodiester phosphodiesterase family protein [Bacteroidia bacterium]
MNKIVLAISILLVAACSCQQHKSETKMKEVQKYMPDNAVIAHRGTIYWAPELTEPAFRWARNAGADYVELDVQRSKDGVLIIMHDRTFNRTTDVAQKFPGREKETIDLFTCEEIMKLDAGSTFNTKFPDRARSSYKNLDVLVFEDVFQIAAGNRIKRNPDGSRAFHLDAAGKYVFEYEPDPADNGHRPGVYIEYKDPDSYPGLEEQAYAELARFGWNPLEGEVIKDNVPFYIDGKVNVGNTKGKILNQTFSRPSMLILQKVFKEQVPTSFLIGNTKTNDFAKVEVMDEIVNFALSSGAQYIGTNLGDENDGLSPEFSKKIHAVGLKANAYSFNTIEQMEKYLPLLEGMITNRADLTIYFYCERGVRENKTTQTPEEVLIQLGYNI